MRTRQFDFPIAAATLMAMILMSSGCDSTDQGLRIIRNNKEVEIDAGVIFKDRASYRCILLSELGLAAYDQLQVTRTSCDCLDASIKAIALSQQEMGYALLLEFKPARDNAESKDPISNLAVLITVQSGHGEIIDLIVRFRYAHFS